MNDFAAAFQAAFALIAFASLRDGFSIASGRR